MKNILVSLILVLGSLSFAADKKVEHRHHHAHNHGSAEISIAFDGLKGRIEFTSPAESILGFEYLAKKQADKDTLAKNILLFQTDFLNMIVFDSSLGCVGTTDKVEQKHESKKSKHSNFIGNFNIECKKTVLNSTLKFDFSKFAKLKDIDVTILVDTFQKNVEISNKLVSVELK